MSSIEDSSLETECGLCHKYLNPPFEHAQVFSLDDSPIIPVCSICLSYIEKIKEIIEINKIA